MQVCFITPKGLEQRMSRGSRIMGLAHLVPNDEAYASYIRKHGRVLPVTLDNGACEGYPVEREQLGSIANYVHANEIVLPDEMGNGEVTLKLVSHYLSAHHQNDVGYMAVVHGSNMRQMQDMIKRYVELEPITCLGIPRISLKQGCRAIRIDLAHWINEAFGRRFYIHMLGASSVWPTEAKMIAKYAPFVRSFDTSMPYSYAMDGVRLDIKQLPAFKRVPDYFDRNWDRAPSFVQKLIEYNEEVLLAWCNPQSSESQPKPSPIAGATL